MSIIDWSVLIGTLLFIVLYGTAKTKKSSNLKDYFLSDSSLRWWHIGLSVMATQASAITFISTPGQAYVDGMGFIQFYFGLPLAMILVAAFFIPVYHRLRVFTAYEYLENRFNRPVRQFTAMLFLIQRGLAAGITIYAPSIILSSILSVDLHLTNISIGLLVIIYTVSGGAKAVSTTQQQQMAVMIGGLFIVVGILIWQITEHIGLRDAIKGAGAAGKMNLINWKWDLSNRYTVWSGIIGGLFLSLSYFGTDQSQVGRYLGGKSLSEIRLGLLFNGFFKIPMQLLILFVGVLMFVFFNLNPMPVVFNQPSYKRAESISAVNYELQDLSEKHHQLFDQRKEAFIKMASDPSNTSYREDWKAIETDYSNIHNQALSLIQKQRPREADSDQDYIFVYYILNYLPVGLIGLLLAVIFSAAMSSTSAELNALSSTTLIDFYKRSFKPNASEKHYVTMSKIITLLWGVLAIVFATVLSLFDNLIEAVNIIGSLFYGTVLGVFATGFFLRKITARAVFPTAIIAQSIVLVLHLATVAGWFSLSYLWYNLIGCLLVCIISIIFHSLGLRESKT